MPDTGPLCWEHWLIRKPQSGCTEHIVALTALFEVKAHAVAGFLWRHQAGLVGREERGARGGGLTRSPVDDVRSSKGTNVASHSLYQLLLQLRAVLDVLHEGHVSVDALPLHWVLIPAEQ